MQFGNMLYFSSFLLQLLRVRCHMSPWLNTRKLSSWAQNLSPNYTQARPSYLPCCQGSMEHRKGTLCYGWQGPAPVQGRLSQSVSWFCHMDLRQEFLPSQAFCPQRVAYAVSRVAFRNRPSQKRYAHIVRVWPGLESKGLQTDVLAHSYSSAKRDKTLSASSKESRCCCQTLVTHGRLDHSTGAPWSTWFPKLRLGEGKNGQPSFGDPPCPESKHEGASKSVSTESCINVLQ